MRVRNFVAEVEYRDREGVAREERFPVKAGEYNVAKNLAFDYVVRVLKLGDFELRLVGA
jgi:hypothetical protein